jgi:hypothetical protein
VQLLLQQQQQQQQQHNQPHPCCAAGCPARGKCPPICRLLPERCETTALEQFRTFRIQKELKIAIENVSSTSAHAHAIAENGCRTLSASWFRPPWFMTARARFESASGWLGSEAAARE